LAELLHLEVDEHVRTLAAPKAVLDPATAAVVAQAADAAHARGYAEGIAEGRIAASAAAAQIVARLDEVLGELLAQRAAAREADIGLAARLAADVLGATPPVDALALLDRVHEAATVLDDDPLEVRLNPADLAAIGSAPHDRRLQLLADPAVAPGEAVLGGAWGGAALTRAAMLDAAIALHDAGHTGPAGDRT
jgi:flagellar biosynthesis/type III secretory pathway protein FliH